MIDDLLNLISEYLDLKSYQLLIPENPKIFTTIKYKKYQNEYDEYFTNKILAEFNRYYEALNKLKFKDSIKQKYLILKHQYHIIQKIIYALEYCNIFISTNLIHELDFVNMQNNIYDQLKKCELTGHLILSIDEFYTNKEIRIIYRRAFMPHNDTLMLIENDILLKSLYQKDLEKYKLLFTYYVIMWNGLESLYSSGNINSETKLDFLLGRGIIETANDALGINLSTLNIEDLNEEYESILELISFRNNRV